ncbi:MAG: hypothetical protein ACERKD_06020 [Prolixibacteraceae bacterium]
MSKFFETPRPKRFHIEPRYWDPKKEERDARQRRINAELGLNKDEEYKPYISKGQFRKGIMEGKWSPKVQRRKSTTRLLILVVITAALVYFMLK